MNLKTGYTRSNRDFGDKGRLYQIRSPQGTVVMMNDGSSICELLDETTGTRWELNTNPNGGYQKVVEDMDMERLVHEAFRAKGFASLWDL